MTDHVRKLTVFLSHDTRDDDLAPLASAIALLQGVASVECDVVTAVDHTARRILALELRKALHQSIDVFFDTGQRV